jgi:hypothetical protein
MLKGVLLQPRRPPGRGDDRSLRGYSNLQLGVSHPHEELGVMVSCHVSLAAEEAGVLFGTLSESGAQLLLVRDGQKEIVPLAASGNFRLWVRDGMVQKYRVHLEGLLQVDTTAGRQTVRVNQTTETVIRDVGRAEFAVPEEARRKLGG